MLSYPDIMIGFATDARYCVHVVTAWRALYEVWLKWDFLKSASSDILTVINTDAAF